jgi:hypothetical protein
MNPIELTPSPSNRGLLRTTLFHLDRLLRGDATRMTVLRAGSLEIPIGGMSLLVAGLGAVYGICMGSYAVFSSGDDALLQMLATSIKVPLLLVLTLVVTFPSLYAFNALIGSRLSIDGVLRLLIASLAVIVAVLASLGPIVAFFSVSTTSYYFMLILNVAVFSLAGILGLKFLHHTLHRMSVVRSEGGGERSEEGGARSEEEDAWGGMREEEWDDKLVAAGVRRVGASARRVDRPRARRAAGALDRIDGEGPDRRVRTVFKVWGVLFAFVGAQMSWVLSPFLGKPNTPFILFGGKGSNFFEYLLRAIERL